MALDAATLVMLAERAFAVAFVGAFLGLDNIAVGQFMLAQPAIAAVLVGYLVGEPALGIWVAVTFQLLWIGEIPVGAYVPPSAPITAIAAVGLAAAPVGVPLATRAVAAAVLAVPVGMLAGRLDIWIKSRNVAVLHRAELDLLDGRPYALGGAVIKGVTRFYLKDFFLLLVAVFVGSTILYVALPQINPILSKGAAAAFVVSPAAGIGAAVKVYWKRANVLVFAAGAGLSAAALLLLKFASPF